MRTNHEFISRTGHMHIFTQSIACIFMILQFDSFQGVCLLTPAMLFEIN